MNRRLRDYGIVIGEMAPGRRNKITDVPGVRVGHKTLEEEPGIHTGVTVIIPAEDNVFWKKCPAAAYVHNGFGKTCGLLQIEELGTLETPIALTNTLNVGLVADGLVEYTLERCRQENRPAFSINPVVGECNDSQINDISRRAVSQQDVLEAIRSAGEEFEEGAVGAGTGTICYGFKGGIGSASRVLSIGGKEYVIGVLVQSNFGVTRFLTVNGRPVGREILACSAPETRPVLTDKGREAVKKMLLTQTEQDRGSILMICATDLPLSNRQLKRLIRRMGNGLARTGSCTGHGSGEIMIGFSTANRHEEEANQDVFACSCLKENRLNDAFIAVAEATEEAVLNSMVTAQPRTGLDGRVYCSLAEFLDEPAR